MREIKFRAWDKYKKEMHIVSKMDWNIFSEEIERISTGYKDNSCLAYNRNHSSEKCDIEALELMQYTGLKDKNGKEIYEGDIVEIIVNNNIVKKCVVEFKNGIFGVMFDRQVELTAFPHFHNTTFEVIGNIYDNPDLLEKGAEDE